MIIKVLLLTGIAVTAIAAIRARQSARHLLVRRVASVAILFAGVVSILLPDLLTRVANALGVGRGADLLLYGLAVTFLFVAIAVYRRVSDLERRCTELVRRVAIMEAVQRLEKRQLGDPTDSERAIEA